jgi:rRNA-processing protein FCF1
MKIGILKSKVEKFLVESMSNNTFKSEIKTFKSLVLEDKDIAKAFYIYDVLDRKRGMSKDDANSLIDECIRQFEKLNLNDRKLSKINSWIRNTKISENSYKQIDNVLDTDNILFETILESKKNLIKTITSTEKVKETSNLPLDKVYEVAENTTKNFLMELSEQELKSLNKYLTLSEGEIKNKYSVISEMVIEKLEELKDNSDSNIKTKIDETVERIKTDSPNQLNLVRLKKLFNTL